MTEIVPANGSEIVPPSGFERVKALVLNSVDSRHTKRAYDRALTDFLLWLTQRPGAVFNKATVAEYRTHMRRQGMGAATINQRLTAIRRLASEAADNAIMDAQRARGVQNVPGVKQPGKRMGNWLTLEEAQTLLDVPDVSTKKGARDRALLAVLLGCGLRRTEAARLTYDRIQQREGRWALVDLVGKRNKLRTVPMASWVKVALDHWTDMAGLTGGRVFRSVNKGDNLSGGSLSAQAVHDVVKATGEAVGLDIAPHDLRRTFAKLARKGGADLEQIQESLGHASIETTQVYLGTRVDFHDAPSDRLGLRLNT